MVNKPWNNGKLALFSEDLPGPCPSREAILPAASFWVLIYSVTNVNIQLACRLVRIHVELKLTEHRGRSHTLTYISAANQRPEFKHVIEVNRGHRHIYFTPVSQSYNFKPFISLCCNRTDWERGKRGFEEEGWRRLVVYKMRNINCFT